MSIPYRQRAAIAAVSYIGTREEPANSNHGVLIDYWCKRTNGIPGGYPWCAAFLYNMFRDVDLDLKVSGLTAPAWVESWVALGRKRGWVVRRPLKGDVVCFDWGGDGHRDHIGIVTRTLALRFRNRVFVGWIETIEGNTSSNNQSNGGQVQRRRRWVNGKQVFVRVPGP